MKRFILFAIGLACIGCGRTGRLTSGSYAVADQEYSSQNYSLERKLEAAGSFAEKHTVDHCLLMEMTGTWQQESGSLRLKYGRIRNRRNCRDSLSEWSADSTELRIPVRNVEADAYESLLAASGGKPEKWIKWIKSP